MQWPMVAALCFVGLSMILSAYLNSRCQEASIEQQGQNARWVWNRFLTLLEPQIVARVREIEALESEETETQPPDGGEDDVTY